MKSKHLRKTIINLVVMIAFIIFTIQACYNLIVFQRSINRANDDSLECKSEREAVTLSLNYRKVQEECASLSSDISSLSNYKDSELKAMLYNLISHNPFIIGGGIWFEPYAYSSYQKYYGPYMYREGGIIQTTKSYENEDSEYLKYSWYKDGLKAVNEPVWSEPYADTFTKVNMITVSSAILRDEKPIGVITLDIGINDLNRIIDDIKVGKTGYAFIITPSHAILGNRKLDINNTLKKADITVDSSNKTLLSTIKVHGVDNYFAISPIGDTGMNLVLIVPKSEIGFNVESFLAVNIATLIIALAIFYIILSSIINKKIINPLDLLLNRTKAIGAGDFSEQISKDLLNRADEFGELAQAVNKMQQELKDYIEELKERAEELDKRNSEIACQSEEINVLYGETTAMNDELNDLLGEIKKNYLSTVSALANAIEAKDTYTKGHCERVTKLSLAIARKMNIEQHSIDTLEFAALLHDIGKIGISADIINKPSRLTPEEFDEIKLHPGIGHKILKDVEFLDASRNILLQHHERVDGKGYPNGLHSDEIDILAKILAAADSYDAMTSDRPYRKSPLTKEQAIEELLKNKGSQFDPDVVDAFVEILRM